MDTANQMADALKKALSSKGDANKNSRPRKFFFNALLEWPGKGGNTLEMCGIAVLGNGEHFVDLFLQAARNPGFPENAKPMLRFYTEVPSNVGPDETEVFHNKVDETESTEG